MSQILVVDDEPIIRTFLAEGLTDAGYVVATARNGAEALDRAARFRSDAVLLDLLMPVMDGLTFLSERQAHPHLAGVPVIVFSAAGIDNLRDAAKLRATAVLSKPLNLDVLAAVLDQVLRESSKHRECSSTTATRDDSARLDTPVRPVGTCPICGAPSPVELDSELSVSSQVRAIHAARQRHVLSHSAGDIARVPLRRQVLRLPIDRRRIIAEWVYDEVRCDWGDQDRRAVHTIDEVLDSPTIHRLWQDRMICSFERCRHES